MDFAVAQKIISENPCKSVSLPKPEHKEMQTIPAEQLQVFLEEAKRGGVYEMYYIELSTGLRRGELLGLKWNEIDWKNGIIKVRRQVARIDGKIVEALLKAKNSHRTVSVSQRAVEVLKMQKAKTNDQYVFPVAVPGRIMELHSAARPRQKWRSRVFIWIIALIQPAAGSCLRYAGNSSHANSVRAKDIHCVRQCCDVLITVGKLTT